MGYGIFPYGIGPYGLETGSGGSFTVVSISGTRSRVFFSHAMTNNAALLDSGNYFLTPVLGATTSISSVTVEDTNANGVTSVNIDHTDLTLGGKYNLQIIGPQTYTGTFFSGLTPTYDYFSLGTAVTATSSAIDGKTIQVTFSQDVLSEVSHTPGIEDASSYELQLNNSNTYPLIPTILQRSQSGSNTVDLTVRGMTSLSYDLKVGPGDSILYEGDILPSAENSFTGTETGNGSSLVSSGKLILQKEIGNLYGWNFADTSGKLTSSATFRTDFSIDFSDPLVFLPLNDSQTLCTFSVSDSGKQIDLFFQVVGGQHQIIFSSGGVLQAVDVEWQDNPIEISLICNRKAGFFSLLWDGFPIFTETIANCTGVPAILGGSAGIQILLASPFLVQNCKIDYVRLRSTQTIYAVSYNFIHSHVSTFLGDATNTRSVVTTQKGPLTKGWGDARPANKDDVVVYVNGTSVDIEDVNPYVGEIYLTTPIPLTPPGTVTVEVDYKWFENPVFPLAGLNTRGLVLNQWSRRDGLDDPVGSPGEQLQTPTNPKGSVDSYGRFPYSVVLNQVERDRPILIGHQYLGFEKAQTAVLNNEDSLVLNQNPHETTLGRMEQVWEGVSISYEGYTDPQFEDPAWDVQGSPQVSLDQSTGILTLTEDSAAEYPTGEFGFYSQDHTLSFPANAYMATRIKVLSYTGNGVFSGVGFGFHDNIRLYLCGLLFINGLEHIGLLQKPGLVTEASSWILATKQKATLLSSTTFELETSLVPDGIKAGDRFQIIEGNQIGVYTLKEVTPQINSKTLFTTSSTFPADVTLWGNADPYVVWETPWLNENNTLRLFSDLEKKKIQLFLGGSSSSLAIDFTETSASPLADATDIGLIFDTSKEGQFFWGALDRESQSVSEWAFVRFSVVPDLRLISTKNIVVSSEMETLPEDDPNTEWFHFYKKGTASIDVNERLLLTSLSSDTEQHAFAYGRVEPNLTYQNNTHVETAFLVERQTSGYGGANVWIRDTRKETFLSTLLYREDPLKSPYRQLIDCPTLSFTGLGKPSDLNWSQTTLLNLGLDLQDLTFQITDSLGEGVFYQTLDVSSLDFSDEGLRWMEVRATILSYTANANRQIGVMWGCTTGSARQTAIILLANPAQIQVVELSSDLLSISSVIQTYTFAWDDGEEHTYRIISSDVSDTVTLIADTTVFSPVLTNSALPASANANRAFFGHILTDTSSVTRWHGVGYGFSEPTTAKRTLGVYKGGDKSNINSWEIPRTDTTTLLNTENGITIEEMDWRSLIELRILRDFEWGLSVYRPDIPLPPYHTGAFATQGVVPSAAWINLEYANIPPLSTTFGSILFGNLNSTDSTRQRWDFFRYRIFHHLSEDYAASPRMVLNQYHMLSSPDRPSDKTPEILAIQTISKTSLTLIPTQIFAKSIYKVVDGNTIYTSEDFEFYPESQLLVLHAEFSFSSDTASVSVVFLPSETVTETYLKAQPFRDLSIRLNEGIPIFEQDQAGDSTTQVQHGNLLNDPHGVLNAPADFVLNDAHKYLDHIQDPNAIFEAVEFYSRNDGNTPNLLEIFTDHQAPDHLKVEYSGPNLTELEAPSPQNFAHEFPQTLKAEGGNFIITGGVVGPLVEGSAKLVPNQHNNPVVTTQVMGANQQIHMVVRDAITGALIWKETL